MSGFLTYRRIKRVIDLIGGGLLITFLSPLWVGLILILTISTHGKPFFKQIRPGQYGCPFEIYKFRTLTDIRDCTGILLPDNERVTIIGKCLRRFSLDEIPQLINVIKGEMSLIGPRPLLMEYLPLYNQRQNSRHDVKPGLSGLVQINGRNNLTWNEKFELDQWYVENLSLKTDFYIFIRTPLVVLSGCGIAAEGEFSSSVFKG